MKRTQRSLRPLLVSMSLSAGILSTFADNVINYNYDGSGNRTYSERAIIIRGADKGSGRKGNPMFDDLTNHKITIYPNPTEGNFNVEISDMESIEKASITIYSTTGTIVYTNDDPDASNEIDITQSPDGMYLLKIIVDDNSSTWKVIKY